MRRARFAAAIHAFDEANGRDPNLVADEDGRRRPAQLLHAERLNRWLLRLDPAASEALRLAARSQHIERWTVSREAYPPGRLGYKKWRSDLARFHAQRAREILSDVGYPEQLIARVEAINLKSDIGGDPETQTMEDALCLVFLQHELAAFAEKTADPAKLQQILRKTWGKMSGRAQREALEIAYAPELRNLLLLALGRD